jgi:hypothetical protein
MPTATLNASGDTFICEAPLLSTVNFGDESGLDARYEWASSAAYDTKALVQFDLSAIPSDVALSPVVRLYCAALEYTDGLTPVVKVYGLRVAFVEAQATWVIRSTGNNWTTAGAESTASDYYATEYGSLDLTTVTQGAWIEITLTSTLTKADLTNGLLLWVDHATVPNPVSGGDVAAIGFWARDYSSATYAPQLRLTYSSEGTPVASLNTVSAVTAVSSSAKQFVVTFMDDTAIDYSSIATDNCTITGPHGYSESATLVSVDVESDGTPRVATYSTPPPSGGWSWLTNGVYTIAIGANQVCDTSSNYVAAGTLGTFSCNISGAPTLRYEAYHTPTGEPFDGDAANHTISIIYGNTSGSPWSTAREVDAAGKPGLYEVDLTAAQGAEAMLSLYGTSTTANVRIRPVLNIPGPNYVPEVDAVKFAGDADAPGQLVDELKSIARGVVQDNVSNSTTVLYTTLPQRGTNGYANQFATQGLDSGTTPFSKTRFILSSADSGSDTVLTFEREWAAPPAGTSIAVKGNEEAAV